jgi:hypothetical protein
MRTRSEYDQAFQIIREVIGRWDPYNLVSAGAPADEFDPEVALLLPRLQSAASSTDAAEAVLSVFSEMFGEAGFDIGSCAKVGEELYTRLQSAGLIGSLRQSAID